MTRLHPLPTRSHRACPHRALASMPARLAVALLATASLAACEVRGSLTSPTTGYSGVSRSGPTGEHALDPALTGVWQRKLWFTDSRGRAYLSETTWSFRGDGSATRMVVTVSFDHDVADRITSRARWSASNGTLEIEWLPPRAGLTRLHYRVSGRTAQIGGDVYLRLD